MEFKFKTLARAEHRNKSEVKSTENSSAYS